MWQSQNPRAQAEAAARNREKERNRKPIHIKRIEAELQINAPTALPTKKARIFLNDVSTKGVGVHSTVQVMPGQSVTLTPEGQNACKLTGKVVWCQESETTSHVMSSARYTHRFGMEFTFKDAAEQAAVEKFINDLLSL